MKWVKILGSAVFLTAVTVFAGNTVQAQDVLEQQVQERVKNQGWSWENGWFYYDEAGNRVTGWKKIGQYWYYFEEANSENPGLMVGNEKKEINGAYYIFSESGDMLTGWIKREEGWYYASSSGSLVNGWAAVGGYWYYLDGQNTEYPGLMVSDSKMEIDGNTYYFSSNGAMRTGWIWTQEGWYYLTPSGAKAMGWQYVKNGWYYLDKDNTEYPGLMVSDCRQEIDGKMYLFEANGLMKTGWIYQNGYSYFYPSGEMATGWAAVNGYWYYLDPLNDNKMVSNEWKEIEGELYYFYPYGDMATQWMWSDNNWYYFSTDGAMKTGWQAINGCWYYFYKENDSYGGTYGTMARNVTIEGYRIGYSGTYTQAHAYAVNVLNQVGWDLWSAFKYSAGLTYEKMVANASPGSQWFANYGFTNGRGNCYVMAATFYYLADTLGYDVHQVTGYVPLRNGGLNPHSWCEIVIDGTVYVFDPDFTHETGRNGYQITYGTSGTWRYTNYSRMN